MYTGNSRQKNGVVKGWAVKGGKGECGDSKGGRTFKKGNGAKVSKEERWKTLLRQT